MLRLYNFCEDTLFLISVLLLIIAFLQISQELGILYSRIKNY